MVSSEQDISGSMSFPCEGNPQWGIDIFEEPVSWRIRGLSISRDILVYFFRQQETANLILLFDQAPHKTARKKPAQVALPRMRKRFERKEEQVKQGSLNTRFSLYASGSVSSMLILSWASTVFSMR